MSLPPLLVASLLCAAAVTYLLRAWERTTALLGTIFLWAWAFWLWTMDLAVASQELPFGMGSVDVTGTFERLGFTFRVESGAIPILVGSFLLLGAAHAFTASISQGHSFVPFSFVLLAGYTSLALLTTGPLAPPLLAPLFLVGLSGIGVFVLQAGRLVPASGPLRTLIPPVIAFPLFLIAAWYIEQIPLNPQDSAPVSAAAQLLAIGMILLLAPVPFHGASPTLAQSAPPVVTAVLTLLYQLAVLHLLFRTVITFSIVAEEAPLGTWLMWAGLATAVWGGIAAAGANSPGRLWGYAALHDWGLIILVLAVPGIRSWPLVLFLFGLRVVSTLTAAAGLATLEQHAGGMELDQFRGIGARLPWNSAAFLLGGLGLAGFPLSAGFTGHWAALQIIAETDWRPAAVVLLASGGAIFGFIQAARVMFGPLANRYLLREQPVSMVVAGAVLLLSVGLAVAPQLMDIPISRALLAFSN